jgi:hypothetical protein
VKQDEETVIYLDHNRDNLHYTNLCKIKITDLYKYTDKIDRSQEWRPIPNYPNMYVLILDSYTHVKAINY